MRITEKFSPLALSVFERRQIKAILLMLAISLGGSLITSAAPLSETKLFFELNHTDGDLGIHASIDGGPYVLLLIRNPAGNAILTIKANGRLETQGLTQLFLESAEPDFERLAPKKFFARFPEGTYKIIATTRSGKKLGGEVGLSHVMAAPVANITVNGKRVAKNCDAVSLPSVKEPVLIDWDPVTQSHPSIGSSGPVEIVLYQFFIEQGDLKFSADLIPGANDVTQFRVPPEIFKFGDSSEPFKFEIIARTATGNNTAIENCFVLK